MSITSRPKRGLDSAVHPGRQAHDTAAGCHAMAAADLVRAARMDTAMGRAKLEHSAASWTSRGNMLQRLSAGHDARLRAVAA